MYSNLFFGVIFCLLVLVLDCHGLPNPGTELEQLFQSGSSWIDKLPSVEVKLKADGIALSTGPSREDIYWMIGYAVLGLILFIILAVAIGVCICKCWSRNGTSSRVIIREMPTFTSEWAGNTGVIPQRHTYRNDYKPPPPPYRSRN